MATKDKLWTASFIYMCIANFFLFFTFYLLLPIMPFYLIEEFDVSKTIVGLVLSSYTIAALIIRPIAAYFLDMINRKPIYLVAYIAFVAVFVGYLYASMLLLFILVRVFHGITFGSVTTASSSLVIDIMPASRRGEGLGYFGTTNNVAMALGPMLAMLVYETYSAKAVFMFAICTGVIGFIFATFIKCTKEVEKTKNQPLSLDRFFWPKGIYAGICLLLLAFPFATITTYIPVYAKELQLTNIGIYFTILAVGLISVRMFSGKLVDRGHLPAVITVGTIIGIFAFLLLALVYYLKDSVSYANLRLIFLSSAIFVGFAYGLIFPAYNTLFVNIAPNNKRASATSTYLTSWDLGIGVGLVLGGKLSDYLTGMSLTYFVGSMSVVLSLTLFIFIAKPHFLKNKYR
ncbi:MAG: MFS transporter [Bacteroidales bacterium]|jgi:MFS family permease